MLFVIFIGMYAGSYIGPGTLVDLNPQIVIPLIDIENHAGNERYHQSVLSNYPWQANTQVNRN